MRVRPLSLAKLVDISGKEKGDVREFAIQGRDDFADGFGSPSGSGDNVAIDGTTTTPVLVRWAIDGLLCRSCGMNSGHETLDNSKLVVDDFGQWGKAVGCAGRIRDL